jgi:hypothetical protein
VSDYKGDLRTAVGRAVAALPGDLVLYLLDPSQRSAVFSDRDSSHTRAVILATVNVVKAVGPEVPS